MGNVSGVWQARLARLVAGLAAARHARAVGVALLAVAAVAQVVAVTLTNRAGAPVTDGAVAGGQDSLTGALGVGQVLALGLLALVATVPLAFFRPGMAAVAVTLGNGVALASFGQVTAAGVAAELIAASWLGHCGAGPGGYGGTGGYGGRGGYGGPAVTLGRYLAVALGLPFLAIALARGGGAAVFLAAAVPVAAGLGVLAWAGRLARTRSAAGEALADTLLAHTARGERARIARELHDVVAHHISMIAVLAETGRLTTPGLPEAGARRFTEIGDTARAGLTEMRRLLGVLREDAAAGSAAAGSAAADTDRVSRRPQPGLAQLTELVDAARDASPAGTRLIISGTVTPLDPGVELAAFRIVQEALTNVRRHAAGAAVDVELRYCAETLRVRVRDNGPGPAGAVGGHGLSGMRERAFSVGGSLYAGLAPGGGFLVEAVLPADRASAGVSPAADGAGGLAGGAGGMAGGAGGMAGGGNR